MAESWIKIRASVNEIDKHFNECPSELFFIKYYNSEYNGIQHYKGDDDTRISFEALIRHNEIGNRTIERKAPYTLESLEKTISQKVKEYEDEMTHPKKYVEEHIDNLIRKLEIDKELEMD